MDELTSIHATATQRPRPPCFDSIQHDRTYKRVEQMQLQCWVMQAQVMSTML